MGAIVSAFPTIYRGIRFRSRLEARWAAVFNVLGWPWRYEPPEIDLHYYIPDFILDWPCPMLVEVKPMLSAAETDVLALEKIEQSGWFDLATPAGRGRSALLVGAVLPLPMPLEATPWHVITHNCDCPNCGEEKPTAHQLTAPSLRHLWADAGNRTQWMPRVERPRCP